MTFDTELSARLVAEAMEDEAALEPADIYDVRDIASSDYSVLAVVLAVIGRNAALASQLGAAIVELNGYRETEGTNAICFDKVVADRDAARAEVERVLIELRERRAAIAAFADAVSRAVRANEQRGKGGQQVPFFDDFCNAPPSVLVQLQRWVRMLGGNDE